MTIRNYAITYPQLMNRASELGYSRDQLQSLRQAHDYTLRAVDGLYRAQGTPFICHLVRTAAIVMEADSSIEVVMAALNHSAYILHLFDNSRRRLPSEELRQDVRSHLGDAVESLVAGYCNLPWYQADAIQRHLSILAGYNDHERSLLLLRLANELEDYLDNALVYGDARGALKRIEFFGKPAIELAKAMNYEYIANDLDQAYSSALSRDVDQMLIRGHNKGYEMSATHWFEGGPHQKMLAGATRIGRTVLRKLRG